MENNFITTTSRHGIYTITLNRPEKHNAMCINLVEQLFAEINKVKTDDSIKAVFITGNEKAFSAGGDLDEMKFLSKDEAEKRSLFVQDTFKVIQNLDVPVVAFISGICFGGGMELALHTDFRYCTSTARFALPEVKYGIIPGAGGTVQLPQQLNLADAAFYLLTGNEIPVAKLQQAGFIQKVIDGKLLTVEMENLAEYFSSISRKVLLALKDQLKRSRLAHLQSNYSNEAALFASLLSSQGRTGIDKEFTNRKD